MQRRGYVMLSASAIYRRKCYRAPHSDPILRKTFRKRRKGKATVCDTPDWLTDNERTLWNVLLCGVAGQYWWNHNFFAFSYENLSICPSNRRCTLTLRIKPLSLLYCVRSLHAPSHTPSKKERLFLIAERKTYRRKECGISGCICTEHDGSTTRYITVS